MSDFNSFGDPSMDNGNAPSSNNPNGEHANGDAPKAAPPVPGWVEKEVLDYSTMEGRSGEGAFDGSARVYEWNEDYGDVGPRNHDLEKELFGSVENGETGAGLDFSK